jgi:hypothetical protein
MSKGFKIDIKGLTSFSKMNDVVWEAITDCMDDIQEDALKVSKSIAPKDSGDLEKSISSRKYRKKGKIAWFSLKATAENKGFDYAEWTHDKTYNLGKKSRAKRPQRSRFSNHGFRVGKGYMSQVPDALEGDWTKFMQDTVTLRIRVETRKNKK